MSVRRKIARASKLALFLVSTSMPLHGHATKFDALDPLGTARKANATKKDFVEIEVAPGDWGHPDLRDIHRVLDAVAAEFLTHVRPAGEPLRLRVVPRSGAPKVLYERGAEGQYVVQLTARGDRWFQYAFQFAHELCHVVSNFDHKEMTGGEKVAENNQWFEESLCETASLFTLRRLAARWETAPPTRNLAGYSTVLAAYAERLTSEAHRQLPPGQSFQTWYDQNRTALNDNPYLRDKNELVAAQLLPLFEAHPEWWQAVPYLNPRRETAAKPFSGYVADWLGASPDKALPVQVHQLFGLPAGEQLAAVAPRRAEDATAPAPPAANQAVNGPPGR